MYVISVCVKILLSHTCSRIPHTAAQLTITLPQSALLKGKYYNSWSCFSAGCLVHLQGNPVMGVQSSPVAYTLRDSVCVQMCLCLSASLQHLSWDFAYGNVCACVQKLLSCVKATCLSKPHLERTEVTHLMWKRFTDLYDNI